MGDGKGPNGNTDGARAELATENVETTVAPVQPVDPVARVVARMAILEGELQRVTDIAISTGVVGFDEWRKKLDVKLAKQTKLLSSLDNRMQLLIKTLLPMPADAKPGEFDAPKPRPARRAKKGT